MSILLIDKITPKNEAFTGLVDAKHVIGGASNVLPDATMPNLTGDVTTTEGAVATTIAAKAVDVAMLADGTDGQLITWGADGVATTVATGTSTHVLTSNGAGAAPTFQAATGGVSDGDKGDITVSGSGATWTIDNGVVTLAKQADMATASLVGRNTAGAGAPEVITDIPTAVTIGTKYIYRADGTDVPVADGGTGASTLTDKCGYSTWRSHQRSTTHRKYGS